MNNKSHLIIKALRKYYGSTQVEFSHFLGVSQGALSKIEAGKLEVSAMQWIHICDHYQINPSALMSGVINTKATEASEAAQRKYFRSFKVPKRYSLYAESTVRTIFPFLRFMEHKLGIKKTWDFFKKLGFEEEYFVVLDNPVNLVLISDVVDFLANQGLIGTNNLEDLFKFFPIHEIHSYVLEDVKFSSNVQTALVKFITQIGDHYERNTQYEFVGDKNCYIMARDRDHVKEFSFDNNFTSFRREYNARYFEHLCNQLRPETMNFSAKKVSGGWDVIYA